MSLNGSINNGHSYARDFSRNNRFSNESHEDDNSQSPAKLINCKTRNVRHWINLHVN